MDILLQGIQQRSQPLDVIFLDLGDLGFRGLGFRGLGFRGFGFTVFEDVCLIVDSGIDLLACLQGLGFTN